ncbi:hydantoinase/oxoprolinase family protein [Actinacidiphila bryophytorum]|nr:hydantoinase/oxoprolinase family protein [Actinacidiphila bryophytorum]
MANGDRLRNGGTSTDVCHHAKAYECVQTAEVARVRLPAPMPDSHTAVADGGSVLPFDGGRYQLNGPLTVTDANVMLGTARPDCFPRMFGPDGALWLDGQAVRRQSTEPAQWIRRDTGDDHTPEQGAEGYPRLGTNRRAPGTGRADAVAVRTRRAGRGAERP